MLKNRDFLCYLLGRLVSTFGQQMLTVAVGWELYERTHSSLMLGLVGLSQFLPMVAMTLPAGHLADSRERKKIILVTEAFLCLTSLGLAAISIWQFDATWMFACLVGAGIARTFLWSATASFVPLLVSREEFPRALNWSSSTFQFASVAGPAAGGLAIAVTHGATVVYIFNACAAVMFMALVSFVRLQHKPAGTGGFSLDSLLGGFRFVFQNQIILGLITLDLFAVMFGGATALLPVYAKDILRVGPTGLGLLQAALPIGSLVCALYLAHRPPLQRAGRSMLWAVAIFGVATIGFGFSRSFWLSLLLLFIAGFADNISVIVRHTLVQLLTPDQMRGRVSAVNNLFIGTSNELGGFESGTVAAAFGPVFSVVSGGIGTILVVLATAWHWPQIRAYGRLVQPVENNPPPT